MSVRTIQELLTARPASDGDGVNLLRVFGGRPERFDPFLMLDEFGSDKADDYIGGFPPHPHRGFQTVTYMLHGKMEHRDHMGNVGLLEDGGVQWMSAGKGVIHSEMPKQTEGKMRGFQLWVNLPSTEKMQPAAYRDIPADDIPSYNLEGLQIKAVAGAAMVNGTEVTGSVTGISMNPLLLDVSATQSGTIEVNLPESHNLLVYVYEGELNVGDKTQVAAQQIARFSDGEKLTVDGVKGTRFLVIAGERIKEPVAQYGPFVMNTMEEVEQAIQDYKNGVLTD